MIRRIILFGDTHGLPMLLHALPCEMVCGIVAAEIRPQYHEELQKLAEEKGIPFAIQPLSKSPDYPNFVQWVRELSPQLLWVNSYSMKLREEILRIPEAGALNIHGALLPYYRGCNPTQWAILRDESATGVTLHEVTAGIDEGPIIARKEVPLLFEDTWKDVQD
ncbi:MAG TPA: formyltransferase family protein, partial [Aminobacteriaceae bacterium]|nr:formyltransferase family protein [Aminobacteriaceae bacterium]